MQDKFRPNTLQHQQDGSKLSGQCGTGAELSVRHFGTSAYTDEQ